MIGTQQIKVRISPLGLDPSADRDGQVVVRRPSAPQPIVGGARVSAATSVAGVGFSVRGLNRWSGAVAVTCSSGRGGRWR
ncbi:hypothetical protein [Rhodococcus sp. NJ-530]|uniref:hypothetical protein n=1 Tax=Rhodococcus sp. NJ-530 TaxID=2490853 RepID=UPI0032175C94